MIRTTQDIRQLGAIMGIWAHPDDETWGSAGIMAAAVANEQRVSVLSATKGDAEQTADETTWARKDLRHIRESEFGAALSAVGVDSGILLHYDDGKLKEADESEVIEVLTQHILAFAPNTILTFEPNRITGHSDHMLISKWARQAANQAQPAIIVYGSVETKQGYEAIGKQADELFNVYFATDEPVLYDKNTIDICFELPAEIQQKKLAAMQAHGSQTASLFTHPVGKKLVEASLANECFIKL